MSKLFLFFLCITLISCYSTPPKASHTLHIAMSHDPCSLDPTKIRDQSGKTFAHLFFEGLTRLDSHGVPQLALAKEMTVSPDHKCYTFILREAYWSNGDPVTAYDFENTWKNSLNPLSSSPNAYQLYVIEGAKEANEGTISLDKVGVHAVDACTLIIRLNEPIPYVLNLLATYYFYPVHSQRYTIQNGPFQLKSWVEQNEIVAIKNPLYWDASQVKLSEITFSVIDNNTALRLFEKGELDWIGSPSGSIPPDALPSLKKHDSFYNSPANATNYIRINTASPPFNNRPIRHAFRDAIRRKELVEHILQGNQAPAYSLVPSLSQKSLFKEESLIPPLSIPAVTCCYAASEQNHKIAQTLQEQWRVNLGVLVNLQSYESKVFFEKIKKREYQLALGGWFADIADPISFLDVFKETNNGINDTQWENVDYKNLLDQSSKETNPILRTMLLEHAEQLLIEETPIIPLFHYSHNYSRDPNITDIYFSDLGYIDLKHADVIRD